MTMLKIAMTICSVAVLATSAHAYELRGGNGSATVTIALSTAGASGPALSRSRGQSTTSDLMIGGANGSR